MSEENFKVGDLVVLNEKGIKVFPKVSDSYMPMRIEQIEDGLCKCLLKGGERFVFFKKYFYETFSQRKRRQTCFV